MKKICFIALISIALGAGTVSCSKDNLAEETVYTVKFDTDGGSPVPAVQNVKAGDKVTAPTTVPIKTGYMFLFWRLSGVETAYNFEIPVNSNITLVAKWVEESKVEYWQVAWNLNGGAWAANSNHATQVVKGGTLSEPNPPTKAGNTFDGWYKETALTNKVTFPYDVSSVTANITLYAKWITDNGGNPADGEVNAAGYRIFTSIAELKTWLNKQSYNNEETAHKIGLKGVNLDSGNNWGDLGIAIGSYYVHLDLSGCTGATMPDGRVYQGTTYGVFAGCHILSVNLPNTLRHIGHYAFYRNPLETVTLPEGMKTIGEYAFRSCTSLQSAALPENLETIDDSAFRGCDKLASINFPKGLVTIGSYAFQACKLESVVLPSNLKTIGIYTFNSCNSIISVTLPESLENIGHNAFSSCSALTTVSLPNGLKTISNSMFGYCTALKTITIPASVTTIDGVAFTGCTALVAITMLPVTPPTLGSNVFQSTNNTFQIKVPAASLNDYKTASGWSVYAGRIVAN